MNRHVVLCERGIRTFETSTRNTLDLGAVQVLKARSHLPVIVDPAAASFIVELQRRGVDVRHADNSVLDGIRTVGNILASDRLLISKYCHKSIMEMQSYSWDPKAQKNGADKPLKTNDHAADAIRYVVMHAFNNEATGKFENVKPENKLDHNGQNVEIETFSDW